MSYVTSVEGSVDPGYPLLPETNWEGLDVAPQLNQNAAARRRQMRLSSTPGKVWVGPLHQPGRGGNYADFTMVNFGTKRPSFGF